MNGVAKYLPVGSVVLLKGGEKKLMVVGFLGKSLTNEGPIFDYIGCLYPEGMISPDKNYLFNHTDIEKIFFLGYSDDSQKEFAALLNQYNITSGTI